MNEPNLEPSSPLPPPPAAYPQPAPGHPDGAVASSAYRAILPPGVSTVSPWARFGAYLLDGILSIATLGIGWIIWAAMIGGNGQTPAKQLLDHRVIGADTLRPVGLGKMFWMRGLVAGLVAGLAILFTLGILLFMPFWDKRNQNLWDKVSNTYVVSDPNDAWSTKPSGI